MPALRIDAKYPSIGAALLAGERCLCRSIDPGASPVRCVGRNLRSGASLPEPQASSRWLLRSILRVVERVAIVQQSYLDVLGEAHQIASGQAENRSLSSSYLSVPRFCPVPTEDLECLVGSNAVGRSHQVLDRRVHAVSMTDSEPASLQARGRTHSRRYAPQAALYRRGRSGAVRVGKLSQEVHHMGLFQTPATRDFVGSAAQEAPDVRRRSGPSSCC